MQSRYIIYLASFSQALISCTTESYYSANFIKEDNHIILDNNAGLNFLSLINHNGVPLHHLRLKVGAVCTLMRNMSVKKGLVKNA